MRIGFTLLCIFLALPAFAGDDEDAKLPLPRFASLKPDEVNVRSGPGTRYTIAWVYRKKGFPVEILEEFDAWREIRDFEGNKGWVHKQMLSGRRTGIITKAVRVLYSDPESSSPPVLRVEPKVMGQILECAPDWCRLMISGHKGWLPKKHFWGAYASEVFEK